MAASSHGDGLGRAARGGGLARAWALVVAVALGTAVALGAALAPGVSRAQVDDAGVEATPRARGEADEDGTTDRVEDAGASASASPTAAGANPADTGAALDAGDAGDAGDGGAGDGGAGDGGAGDGGAGDAGVASGAEDAGLATSAEGDGPAEATMVSAQAVETTEDVVRTLLGLVALLTLAWLGGHERVRRLEERIGIAQVMTSGFPFVLLGLLARAPGIDVLTDDVLGRLTPLLQFGLGWIGFHTGFQLDSRAVNEVPRGTATVVILLTALPFLFIAGLAGSALWALELSPDRQALARDAVMLGLAGALSAPTTERLARAATARSLELVRTVSLLDDAVCVVAFACLAAWLRPASPASGWALPAVGWVFVTFGMAGVLGLLTYTLLRGTDSQAEKTSLLLGAVCLTSGLAATFSLAPLVVCFLAGVILRNLPGDDKRQLEDAFGRLERPIYHLFLIIVGALWRPESTRAWLVLPLFLVARTLGRFAGARLSRVLPADGRPESLDETSDAELFLPPMGQLALAFVITAQTLYESAAIRAMVNAVIVGSIVMEVIVQVSARRRKVPDAPPAEPRA